MKKIIFLLVLSTLFSCAKTNQGDTLVLFLEREDGVEPYQTRMIVNDKFLRIDDGKGTDSFVLYDRVKKVVYSTNPDEKTIMAVHKKTLAKGRIVEPPFTLTHSVKSLPELKDAPTINGITAKHFQLITNNTTCYDVVAVKGLMPNVVKALIEFHQHMATDSVLTFNNMPADMHDACDMTMTTFNPEQRFQFGFPIQEWGKREYMRTLVDYDVNYKADKKLFVLPEGYNHYTVQDLREGKVRFSE